MHHRYISPTSCRNRDSKTSNAGDKADAHGSPFNEASRMKQEDGCDLNLLFGKSCTHVGDAEAAEGHGIW
jgi:hypothetical protein